VLRLPLRQFARRIDGTILRGNPHQLVHNVLYRQREKVSSHSALFLDETTFRNDFFSQHRGGRNPIIVTTGSFLKQVPLSFPMVLVSNVLESLYQLGSWERKRATMTVIGITGSQGKTTTKEMLASILKETGPVLQSTGNANVAPFTAQKIINRSPAQEIAVIEMGMSRLGKIRHHCQVAQPTIGIITNVGEAHVGRLDHSLENVVRAKQELIDGLQPDGLLVLNADDPGSRKLNTSRFRGEILTYGIRTSAHFRAQKIRFLPRGMAFTVNKNLPLRIPSWGEHNVSNALAAVAVATHLRLSPASIRKGLLHYPLPKMRLQPLRGVNGHLLLNDAFNATPTSTLAGLEVLKKLAHRRQSVAILGDLHELGRWSRPSYERIGKEVAALGIDFLITVGGPSSLIAQVAFRQGMPLERIESVATLNEAERYIRKRLPADSVLYFKASRKTNLSSLAIKLSQNKKER
jgi:UDP-N-acetylmuramoyl-tripeptide--D-alanyl-D-alanine ligase